MSAGSSWYPFAAGVIDAELACHSGHDWLGYRSRVLLERADRPNGDQLGRIAQLGHRIGTAPDHRQSASLKWHIRPSQSRSSSAGNRAYDAELPRSGVTGMRASGRCLLQAPHLRRPKLPRR